MKAGAEKIFLRKHKRIQLICVEGTVSKELMKFCDMHYLNDNQNPYLNDLNFQSLKSLFRILQEEKKITLNLIGQNANKSGFKYKKGKLLVLLKKFEKQGKIHLTKEKDTKEYLVKISK